MSALATIDMKNSKRNTNDFIKTINYYKMHKEFLNYQFDFNQKSLI